MKSFFSLILITASLTLAVAQQPAGSLAPAERARAVVVTPEFVNELAEEAFKTNPALAADRARVEAAEADVEAVRVWEDPMFMIGGMGARTMMRSEDGDIIYGLEQKLPLFGKPALAKQVARVEVEVERATEEYNFQILRRDLAIALFRAAYAESVVEIGGQDLVWLDTLIETVEHRFQTGDATQVDLLRLQNERSKRLDQLRTDERMRDHELFALNRMLNRDLTTRWPKLELPELAPHIAYTPGLAEIALRNEPKIKIMEQEIKQADAVVELTRRDRLPDINVGVEGRTYSGDGSFRQGMVFLSMNIPWGNAKKYRSDVRREEARRNASELELKDYELEVLAEIHGLIIMIDAARREALVYHNQVIPRTEQVLSAERVAWESASGSFRDLLDARRMLLDAQLMYARAVAEQYKLLSDLILCCGLGDLEALEKIAAQTLTED